MPTKKMQFIFLGRFDDQLRMMKNTASYHLNKTIQTKLESLITLQELYTSVTILAVGTGISKQAVCASQHLKVVSLSHSKQ